MFGCFMNLSAYLFVSLSSVLCAVCCVLCALRRQYGLFFSVNYMLFHHWTTHYLCAVAAKYPICVHAWSKRKCDAFYLYKRIVYTRRYICMYTWYTNILSGQKQKF